MRLSALAVLPALVFGATGCSTIWPTVVQPSPRRPLFHSEFPMVGGARLDGALCSLASVGPDATLLVSPPQPVVGPVPLAQACQEGGPAAAGQRGRVGRPVEIATAHGLARGYLYGAPGAVGIAVAFTGLGMPAAGWINERFAEKGAARGLATFALVREESERPIRFDPLREARKGIEAALAIRAACGLGEQAAIRFLGISMGGLEALLANREALGRGLATRAAVLDPALDVALATANLDSYWHSLATDSMQGYFRRILMGRYGEPDTTTFGEVMRRLERDPAAETRLPADEPRVWLCDAQRSAYALFLSDTDPVLGDEQRRFAIDCKFPARAAQAPGHTPLACRLELFDEMIDELAPRAGMAGMAELKWPPPGGPAGAPGFAPPW